MLDLSGAGLTSFPPLEELANVHELYLNDNQLEELPPYLGELEDLRVLELANNRIWRLPKSIGALANLTRLDVSYNELTALPRSIEKVQSLRSLFAQSNKLSVLSEAVAGLSHLMHLDMRGNHLHDLPSDLTALQQLECLLVGSVDESDAFLDATTRVHLSRSRGRIYPQRRMPRAPHASTPHLQNHIREIPAEIGALNRLRRLDLSGNDLRFVPPEIQHLHALETLDLSANALTSLPPEIGKLEALVELNVSANELVALPVELAELSRLKVLDITANKLTKFPMQDGPPPALTSLRLARNHIAILPDSPEKLPPALIELDLTQNSLVQVPPAWASPGSIQTLRLGCNRIATLPREFGTLDPVVELDLAGNPLADPLPALLEDGLPALLRYLRSLAAEAVPLYEAKVLLVGEGNVGKSSLVAALTGAPFVENRPTTHGIERHTAHLPHPTLPGTQLSLNTWDFGGQEVYRITHRSSSADMLCFSSFGSRERDAKRTPSRRGVAASVSG